MLQTANVECNLGLEYRQPQYITVSVIDSLTACNYPAYNRNWFFWQTARSTADAVAQT